MIRRREFITLLGGRGCVATRGARAAYGTSACASRTTKVIGKGPIAVIGFWATEL
jgi:hypothetical protein